MRGRMKRLRSHHELTLIDEHDAAVEHIPFDVLIDGEAVGDKLHAFDLLEVKGNCLRHRRYIDRFAGLMMVIPPRLPALRWISPPPHLTTS